jgi:hypothetical protein
VPDLDRPLVRPRPHLRVRQCGAEAGGGGDLVLPPDLPEHLVALGVAVPLVLGRDLEQLALRGAVVLADDQVETPVGEVVGGGVVLGPDRVQQAERRDGRDQPDPLRQGGHMAEYDGRGRGDERPLVPLAHTEAVEARLLGHDCVVEHLAEAVVGRLAHAGDGIRVVRDEGDGEELHDAARSSAASGCLSPRW